MRIDALKRLSILGLACLLIPTGAIADAPAFDRPGIAFAPSTLAQGTFDWEQGLPDAQRDSENGVRVTSYTADTTVRIGLSSTTEVQIAGSAWNRLDVETAQTTTHADGAGDTRLSIKWAPALPSENISLAMLGTVTLDTGSPAFTNGRPIYSLGATIARDVGAGCEIALYANVDRSGGADTWTLSPNISFPIAGPVGGFFEAGRIAGGGASDSLAGGGMTWLLHDRVQFDLYARRGLTAHSPDRQAGFGVSAYWN